MQARPSAWVFLVGYERQGMAGGIELKFRELSQAFCSTCRKTSLLSIARFNASSDSMRLTWRSERLVERRVLVGLDVRFEFQFHHRPGLGPHLQSV
ncbi:MAG: hypothetical protein ACI87E_000364 [Mariniblastus sp.]|jgi:hypothetical protein